MSKTTRIAAVLSFALVCLSAQAMSLKDWLAKSKPDQVQYLSNSLARLVVDVGKTDPQLAKKITSYYADKAAGAEYPPGMNDLFARIGRMVRQSETDKTVDLSKIEFEQVVVLNTAEKFKIPVPADFQRSAGPSAKPRPAAPSPAPPPTPAPRPAAPKDVDNPIGPGGFITPPTEPVHLCVPADLVRSWENPSADPEMEAFRHLLGHYALENGQAGEIFRVRSDAFVDFERARRAASPSTPPPDSLVYAPRPGQRCSGSDRIYDVNPPAPQK